MASSDVALLDRADEPDTAARTLVVVPTYNERENLERFVGRLLGEHPDLGVLVVDDGSPDGTGDIADRLAEADPRVRVLHRTAKTGLGRAYVDGFRWALTGSYEYVVQMDADFSHRVEDLGRLLEAARSADVAIGSRSVAGGRSIARSPLRRLVSDAGALYARAMLRLPVRDATAGYKCLRRRALLTLDLDGIRSRGYAFQVEVNYRCHRAGLRLVEVPIVFPDRAAGASKMSWRIFVEAWLLVLRLRLGELAGLRRR